MLVEVRLDFFFNFLFGFLFKFGYKTKMYRMITVDENIIGAPKYRIIVALNLFDSFFVSVLQRSFLLLNAIAKSKGKLIAIAFKCEKGRQLLLFP